MTLAPDRWQAVAGIAGPAAFVAAWAVLGHGADGYSPVGQPISELAALGASTRPAMTAGFVAFGLGVGAYAKALERRRPGAGWAAGIAAVATAAVAAVPLGGDHDGRHAVPVAIAYTALAAMPLLGARSLAGPARAASIAAGAATGGALVASVLAPGATGLFQRAGLTAADVWLVATAAGQLRARRSGAAVQVGNR